MKKAYVVWLGVILGGFVGFLFDYKFLKPDYSCEMACAIVTLVYWAIFIIIGATIGGFIGQGLWRRKHKT